MKFLNFYKNFLKILVLLVKIFNNRAHLIYETIKNTYGSSNCHLLQINSKPLGNESDCSGIPNEIGTNEFDPWLRYCKFNEIYLNNSEQLKLSEVNRNSIENDEENDLYNREKNSSLAANSLSDTDNNTALNFKIKNFKQKKHGICLSLSDHDRIKTFFSEFLMRGLIPYTEKTLRVLNEQIQSKKSIFKGFSISRKLFGSSSVSSSLKTSSSSSPIVSLSNATLSISSLDSSLSNSMTNMGSGIVTFNNQFIHPNDDLNMRRLADLAFMFRLYDIAFNNYHFCKKEFTTFINNFGNNQANNEQLLNIKMYLAGSLEMATISSFMQSAVNDQQTNTLGTSSTNSLASLSLNKSINTQYIEESIQIYLNDCKNTLFSTRCTIFSTEIFRATNYFSKAAYQFINLANDETDIRSSLFLEQAALCFLAQTQPWLRKYSFFMSLAAHRFNKIGQVIIF